jgi:hypothetical protein
MDNPPHQKRLNFGNGNRQLLEKKQDINYYLLGVVVRKSMQPSHLQCSSENPQNPDEEQQRSTLLGSHSPAGPKFHAGQKVPHLNTFS